MNEFTFRPVLDPTPVPFRIYSEIWWAIFFWYVRTGRRNQSQEQEWAILLLLSVIRGDEYVEIDPDSDEALVRWCVHSRKAWWSDSEPGVDPVVLKRRQELRQRIIKAVGPERDPPTGGKP